MSWEVHIDWRGQTCLVGRLHAAGRGPAVSFEYALEWLERADAFPIDPTALPLQSSAHHSPVLFGAIQDCGPDRWGRILIERAVRKKVIAQKPYRDIDYASAFEHELMDEARTLLAK
jgi:serine/threonine-protein kinase HipA